MGEGRSEREKHKGLLSHSRHEIGPGSPLLPFCGKGMAPSPFWGKAMVPLERGALKMQDMKMIDRNM